MTKSPLKTDRQLNICFDTPSLLIDCLNQTDFFLQFECALAENGRLGDSTLELVKTAEQLLPPGQCGYYVSSHLPAGASISPVPAAAQLSAITQSPISLALSGQGHLLRDLKEQVADAKSHGFGNFIAVTGNIAPDHHPDEKGQYPAYGKGYSDSLDILNDLSQSGGDVCIGATVNPYKYTPEDQCLQYAKMVRKCEHGARFLVAQAGWDMKKAQELQWFMQMRDILIPTLARVCILSQQKAQALERDVVAPGIILPLPIASKLQSAAQNTTDFQDYQLKLAALQCIGLILMGYNGIQLAGLENARQLEAFLETFNELRQMANSYETWLKLWFDFNGSISFAPPPTFHSKKRPHYLFSNLLEPTLLNYSTSESRVTSSNLAKLPFFQKLSAALLRPQAHGVASKIAKSLFKTGDEQTYGLNNDSCPKRLTLCPCGNSRSDGYCEANHQECLFKKVVDLSSAFNEMNILE